MKSARTCHDSGIATSTTLLWRAQGRAEQTDDLLAPVCNRFTGGFDTTNLKKAKTLLDALSA
jgi:hypothetical protein